MGRRTEYLQPDVLTSNDIASIATVCVRWHGYVVIPTPHRALAESEIRALNREIAEYGLLAAVDHRSPSGLAVLFIERQPSLTGVR